MKRIRWGIPLIVALWVGACGLPESPTGGAGGVTFDLIWQEEGQNSLILDSQLFAFSPNSFHPQSLPAAVVGLRATITGSDMDQVTQTFSGLYPEGGTIVIRGVPAGDNRTLVLDGLNAGGAIVYQGTINGFTVVAEQANDIGQIVMRPYGEGIVAAPSNLQVQAVSSSQLALSWVDNANNETGFYLERKTSVGSAYSQVGSVGRDVTAYQDESLSCGMLYFYRVFAYGAVENSGYSNEVSIFLPCVDTVITLAPPSATQSPAPLFGFSCTFASCSFECDLDGGGYAICDSPHGYTGIADGQHVFSVRAVDISGRVDSSPATYSWKVDRVPPETSITQSPSSPSNSTVAFGFDCDEGNCSYECNIDSGNFSACTLPAVYRFENGVHAFSVRATDQAGNVDPTPADYSWLVIGRPNGPPGEEVPPEPIGFWQKTRSKTVPSGRYYHTAVWTGTEMIVWGGYDGSYMLDTGGRYDSSTDAWTPTGIDLNTPWGREYHTAVWDSTDGVMIVWGGYNGSSYFDDGGRYNPATDSWIPTKNASTIPYGRQDTSAVWTGSEMIIWGGYNGSYLNDGGRYDPATDTWTATVIDGNTPSGRQYQTAVWTGSEMIVWGGYNGSYLNDGGRYDPAADTWTATAIDGNTPSPRDYHTAVWDRNDGVMIVWGGTYYDGMYYYYYNGGGRYDPSGDSWATVSTDGPLGRSNHTAIWTGTEMIVWGGYSTDMMGLNPNYYNDGGRYTPFTDAWTATLADGSQPSIRSYQTAVWDSTNGWMIVWGGWDGSTYLNDGGRYDPSGDLWTPTAIDVNTPSPREYHTAVWTGADMIVWGGNDGSYTNTGGRYNPSSDTWIAATAIDGYTPSGREYHNAVWTGTEMLVWGGYDGTYANTGSGYDPSQDSWRTIAFVPLAREYHSAVWTGTEMIVWGGIDQSYSYLDTGGRYNPANDSWTPTGTGANVPSSRAYHTAVWTGTEMIVWGGYNFNGESTYYFNDGGRYDPSSDTWIATEIDPDNTPSGREYHTAVWDSTDGMMIVWGGWDGDSYLNTGGVYEPYSNYWVGTALTDAPAGRKYHTAVWTGDQMIVWGGTYHSGIGELKDGGRYNPSGNSWTQTTDTNAPSARESHTAVWTGSEMIVWGGSDGFDYLDTGGRYDPNPAGDSWKATDSGLNIPSARDFHTAVWTGSEMIVWGGYDGSQFVKTGGRYDPATDSWMPTGIDENTPSGREYHTAVWDNTDGVMIVWGGVDEYGNYLNDGGRYSPGTYAWLPLSGDGAPIGRAYHTAVWTGTEMVVWGGIDQDSNYMNDGGQYDPFLESWMPIATTDAPAGRTNHTAVWTGSEMIVWGGTDQTYYPVNDGGRYDPFLHSWLPISTKNAPTGRQNHTAVWTGYMMIVWGGDDGYYNYLNDGGQYDPLTDRWTEVSTKFAPSGRSYHTAVWSLGVMIVWGGWDGDSYLNTGGVYEPYSNYWVGTALTDAPAGRKYHTAVWTGDQMIVWGGLTSGGESGIRLDTGGRFSFQNKTGGGTGGGIGCEKGCVTP